MSRRDTAIRHASKVLSEDKWTITTCITNKTVLPRTLIKNRKRSKQFLIDAHRSLPAPVNTADTSNVHSSLDETSNSGNQLSQVHPATVQESQSFIHQFPSSSDFSNSLVSREINSLKDKLRTLKADMADINRRPPVVFPSELQQQFGRELKVIRDEFSYAGSSARCTELRPNSLTTYEC